jgi:hypothetical protein
MDADRIIDILDTLTAADLHRVYLRAAELDALYTEWQQPGYGKAQEPAPEDKTYRQEWVKCGKANCKPCQDGQGHGPYWYAYWSEKGRTRKRYIGKTYRQV